jgi:error-prone DNA polymerase
MMGFTNRSLPWRELEAQLSGRPTPHTPRFGELPTSGGGNPPNLGGSRNRAGLVPYAELHCHSNFSFLDGASDPEALAVEADRLGLEALALTDHDGFYGVVRFAEAARAVGLPTVFGAELTLDGPTRPLPGAADPPGRHLVVLATGTDGYHQLSRALSLAQLAGEKGAPRQSLADLVDALTSSAPPRFGEDGHAAQPPGGAAPERPPGWRSRTDAVGADVTSADVIVLTGCRKGTVPAALEAHGPAAAARELAKLVEAFERDRVRVELWDHGHPLDGPRNDALVELAMRAGVGVVATNNVHYATPAERPLATALSAVRARRSLDELDGWLPAAGTAHLRSGAEQRRRFARYPGAIEASVELARACAFDLQLVAPALPPFPCPDGLDEMAYLRRLVEDGATRRYGPRPAPPRFGAGGPPEPAPSCAAARRSSTTSDTQMAKPERQGEAADVREQAWNQIEHELGVIEQLGFPGYFLVVWDIVRFCIEADIFCQGRGSAANSAVCFSLGITRADAVRLGLLFERFLSPSRDGPPDIDLDIESGRREEVIQYVYARYGRHNAAQVANVITYRPRSAVRDMARALGFAAGQQDAWAKQVDRWGSLAESTSGEVAAPAGTPPLSGAATRDAWRGETLRTGEHSIPAPVLDLARQVEHAPRHLGIHSGGMVICDRPVIEVCPVERARMPNRTVLQWDKDDCAAVGLVKFDLLGLGMLTALHHAVDLIRAHRGYELDLAMLDQEDAVYDMLCAADSVGVFQVESRAQMATLPRLKPRTFYDLVVEVALIRPGPIQGGSVHPYIRRRNGVEPVTYLHPLLEPSLAKTLGVPLFQEQFMQISIDVAGFSAAEADELRQAMGSKRSRLRMDRLRERLYTGMAARGITGAVADEIWSKLVAFADYGFPESHSVSFAYLVYSSAWIKLHEPAAFCASLLNAQPMGFYSPHTLVQDARRHGVEVRGPDLARSGAGAVLEPCAASHNEVAVRLGLSSVRGIGQDLAEALVAERDAHGPFTDLADLSRRTGLTRPQLEALALSGAASSAATARGSDAQPPKPTLTTQTSGDRRAREQHRRAALWEAGAAAQSRPGRLPGIVTGTDAPTLPGMSVAEEAVTDLWATGVSPNGHPTQFVRAELDRIGVVPATGLKTHPTDGKVLVGGVVTHRQRPATAGGTMFINLEDETGLVNVICSKGCWTRYRTLARSAPALLVRGRLERSEGVVNVIAERLDELPLEIGPLRSRNFR